MNFDSYFNDTDNDDFELACYIAELKPELFDKYGEPEDWDRETVVEIIENHRNQNG